MRFGHKSEKKKRKIPVWGIDLGKKRVCKKEGGKGILTGGGKSCPRRPEEKPIMTKLRLKPKRGG